MSSTVLALGRPRLVVGLCLAVSLEARQGGQPLSDQDMAAAIVLGRANKLGGLVKRCEATQPSTSALVGLTGLYGIAAQAIAPGNNVFRVEMMPAKGRVATLAWEATQAGRTFGPADVVPVDRGPGLFVTVTPRMPGMNDNAMLPAKVLGLELLAIREAANETFKPSMELAFTPRVWKNAKGATVDYQTVSTVFARDLLRSMPPAPVRLLIATEAGPRSCEFTTEEFLRLSKSAQ